MGMAMGCVGMSLEDFERCTPSEFHAVWECWSEKEHRRERGEWERVRMECLCSLQPWSKKKLRAGDIMEFPWEREAPHMAVQPRGGGEAEVLTRSEALARMERAMKRYGMK